MKHMTPLGRLLCSIVLTLLPVPVYGQDQQWVMGEVPTSFPKLEPYDGKPQEREIWRGVPTKWADLVALRVPDNNGVNEHLCSGVLLRGDTILTAAHCMCSQRRPISYAPFVASAEAGDLTKLSSWREAADYELFPGWSCTAMGQVSDLAVIFLTPREGREPNTKLRRLNGVKRTQPFGKCRPSLVSKSWSDNVLQLSDLLTREPPRTFSVGGFGLDEKGKKGSPLEVTLSITSLACTGKKAQLRWCKPFREMILAAGPRDRGVRDSCGGDSGGPAFWNGSDGVRRLVGIVSRGVPPLLNEPAATCGLGGIYTLIGRPQVHDWLKDLAVGPENVCE